jgi:Spy/CpxP family protein refolding chaperone
LRIRRDLRQAIAIGESARSPETGRLLDGLLDVQRQRLELQQKEQTELSEFLTPEQRARYIGMMEQLRRRIQARADSARGTDD